MFLYQFPHFNLILILFIFFIFPQLLICKKDIRDYNDAELDRLYEQWEENDEDSDDEKPTIAQQRPSLDLDSIRKNVRGNFGANLRFLLYSLERLGSISR
jgi:hypothetical protein